MDGKDVTPEGKEAFLYNDSTYVPLRFLAELLGVNVGWDAETGTVLLGEQPKVPMSYTPGTYTASAAGMMGDVKVEVTVTKDAITAVKVVEQKETPSIGGVALERIPAAIVDNQSLKIDTVSGATMTSKAILAAVEDAIKQAGGDVEALKNASVKTEKPLGDQALTADVVVIGAGGAGLSAALEAKDQGAGKVILLEKMAAIGGTTFTSQGLIGGYDSKLQKEKGIELTFEQMYDNLMSNASYHLDPALTTITLQKSGGTVDWLADRVKMDINDVKVGYGPLQMMHTVKGGGAGMAEPFNAALEEAGVELMLETRATELITDASGAVVGVRAESKGSNIEIAA
ncbi:MAG: FAD-dependent oxidoreductase, partial [Oscillospiraceae bacterium]|nr:FAD-dependent oxidoreductase [Oscillospiraceae bacterium]